MNWMSVTDLITAMKTAESPSGLFYAFVRCSDGNLQATAGDGRMELTKEEVIDLLAVAKRLAVEFGKLFGLIATALPKLKRDIKQHEKESAK